MSKPQHYRITQHAAQRYQERRCRHPLHLKTDIQQARLATKGRLRKVGRWPQSGQRLLINPDNFAFVAAGTVIITCFQLKEYKMRS